MAIKRARARARGAIRHERERADRHPVCFTGLMQRGGRADRSRIQTAGHRILRSERGARLFHRPRPSCCGIQVVRAPCSSRSGPASSHSSSAPHPTAPTAAGSMRPENTQASVHASWGAAGRSRTTASLEGRSSAGPAGRVASRDRQHRDKARRCLLLLGRIRGVAACRCRCAGDALWALASLLSAAESRNQCLGIFNFPCSSDSRHFRTRTGSTKPAWLTRRAPFGEAQLTDAADGCSTLQGEIHRPMIGSPPPPLQPLTSANERWFLPAARDSAHQV